MRRRIVGGVTLGVVLLVLAFVAAEVLRPVPTFTRVPLGSVASEVCEHNGARVDAQRENGTRLIFVTCASGVTPVVRATR